ncbi:endospore germination permease [Paenibacillus sp. RC67]|uniref:GerAB/ArcD/ProY family transporter n=1 Tax=Paenibacillus sp. RC67 TaxID=3039392 RepID=UPI0024ACE140|nr:endospore germination permease [Paenibacillus sp. RC67]
MIEKGRISSFQMAVLMYPTIISTSILSVPSITAKFADKDLWIAPIWAALTGFLVVYILIMLSKLYPGQSMIEYSTHILGYKLGKLLGLIYIISYLINVGIMIREYGEFIMDAFLHETPIIVVMGSMVLVCAFAVRSGLEVLGRVAQVFVPIVVILLLLIFSLAIPDLDPDNMLPIFERGITPSLIAAIPTQTWFTEFIDITILLPFLADREKGLKWGMISVIAVMVSMVLCGIISLLLLGDIVSSYSYPVMLAARYISLADFLEHLEAMAMAVWVLGMFIKISVVYYVLVLMVGQWLQLPSYRPLVFTIGYMSVVYSKWVASSREVLNHMLATSLVFFYITIQFVIPALLLLIALLRNKWSKHKEPGSRLPTNAVSPEKSSDG